MSEEQINPFAEEPVCRKGEVVTYNELIGIRHSLLQEFKRVKWWQFGLKRELGGAGAMIEGILSWIEKGKP